MEKVHKTNDDSSHIPSSDSYRIILLLKLVI